MVISEVKKMLGLDATYRNLRVCCVPVVRLVCLLYGVAVHTMFPGVHI